MDAGQKESDESKLKGALAELRGFIRAVERKKRCIMVKDRETCIAQTIYSPAYETALAMLPKANDEELIHEAEIVLEKANKAAEKTIGG